MADTMDRRSEGKGNSQSRQRAEGFRAQGLCTYCGKTPVSGRYTCYNCSTRASGFTQASNVRKALIKHNIDPKVGVSRLNALIYDAERRSVHGVQSSTAEEDLAFLRNLQRFFNDNQKVIK